MRKRGKFDFQNSVGSAVHPPDVKVVQDLLRSWQIAFKCRYVLETSSQGLRPESAAALAV